MFGLEWYHHTLIAMALVAGVAAWEVPRAVLWLCIGAFFYAVTAYWHNMGYPYATLLGASTNFFICVLLAWPRNEPLPYEMKLFNCIILMLVIDTLYATGFINSHFVFAVSLEIVNAAAMILITATGIADRVTRYERHRDRSWHNPVSDYCNRALLIPRAPSPRWWDEEN